MKTRVLVVIEHYLPGYNAGGPTRSVSNMVDLMGDRHKFYILTRDRDLGAEKPFSDIRLNHWLRRGKAAIFYSSDRYFTFPVSMLVLKRLKPDVVYLNSVFCVSTFFILAGLRLFLSPMTQRVVIASRGEMAESALQLKSNKKKVYLGMCRLLGLFANVTWQASSTNEAQDITRMFGARAQIEVVPNTPNVNLSQFARMPAERCKKPGVLKLATVARISAMKNHIFLLDLLSQTVTDGQIELTLYGPVEDSNIWHDLEKIIAGLPENIVVVHKGALEPENVVEVNRSTHFHILPTLGENFGHSIFEALLVGCPTIISDRTMWTELIERHKAGWALDLGATENWSNVLRTCVAMDQREYEVYSQGALSLSREYLRSSDLMARHESLFSCRTPDYEPGQISS